MTDPIVPEPTPPAAAQPTVPAAPSAPAAPAAPAYAPGAPAYAPVPAGPKQGLSLASFITGIAGVVFFWVPGLGFLAGLAGVILGFIGRKREPAAPKWMSLVGIITGFVAIFLSLIYVVILIVGIIANAALINGINNY